jgi:hypothetical protein
MDALLALHHANQLLNATLVAMLDQHRVLRTEASNSRQLTRPAVARAPAIMPIPQSLPPVKPGGRPWHNDTDHAAADAAATTSHCDTC